MGDVEEYLWILTTKYRIETTSTPLHICQKKESFELLKTLGGLSGKSKEKFINTSAMIILCDIKMRNYVNSTDIKFRLFLLNIFHAQEFTFYDIRNTVHRDYPTKTISDDRLKVLIKKMMGFGLLSRRRLEHRDETNCLYTYAITRQGHKRREYYREKLNQG